MTTSAAETYYLDQNIKRYTKERMLLIEKMGAVKEPIRLTEEDKQFLNAMTVKVGVHASMEYLRGFEKVKHHEDPLPFPTRYSKDLITLVEKQAFGSGVYYTPNAFRKHSAALGNLSTVKACYLDIDFPDDTLIEERLHIFYLAIDGARLPRPTAIINSGSGLHIYYILENEMVDNNKKRGNVLTPILNLARRINIVFAKKFNEAVMDITTNNEIYADLSVTTPNHKLRLVGSYNRFNEVHCVEFNQNALVKDIDDLVEYLPDYDEKKLNRNNEWIYDKKPQNIRRMHNLDTLNHGRVKDLELLAELRGYDMYGSRNDFLHILTCQYIQHSLEDWESKIYDMNSKLLHPLRRQEVANIIKSAVKREYLYRNITIIDKLRISEDEERRMSIISSVSAYERRERKRAVKRENKRSKRRRVIDLYRSGMSVTEISKDKESGYSRRQIYRILKKAGISF